MALKSPGSLWPPAWQRCAEPPELAAWLPGFCAQERLSPTVGGALVALYWPLAVALAERAEALGRPLVLGVNGAQGTGKSTAAACLEGLLALCGARACCLSIDDVYLTRAERQQLARDVHPLFATRGVPGTHDLALAERVLAALRAARPGTLTPLPRFDKAQDDRLPPDQWPVFEGRPAVILLEGWCLGAVPEPDGALAKPYNALERESDPEGLWRTSVNRALADYQPWFSQLDCLVMLKAPSFEQVYEWRELQEQKLRARLSPEELAHSRVMSPAQVAHFISHYERLTRWMLDEMPARADVVIALDAEHRVTGLTVAPTTALMPEETPR
ncbi:phosphoribulokinase [Marinimicrobium alkaliphilum]|uniref:phosphoribulokinase n=1 Tax=Marinimicrobium alkaliphilum TaxID=2202654 RepID=UPI0018E0BA34|nr:phosphoribulokinase [Marinimicrobium alkaliphilum]